MLHPGSTNQMKPGAADLRQDQINHIKLLYESKDWEGLLQLESTVTRVANEIETTDPSEAAGCYLYVCRRSRI